MNGDRLLKPSKLLWSQKRRLINLFWTCMEQPQVIFIHQVNISIMQSFVSSMLCKILAVYPKSKSLALSRSLRKIGKQYLNFEVSFYIREYPQIKSEYFELPWFPSEKLHYSWKFNFFQPEGIHTYATSWKLIS